MCARLIISVVVLGLVGCAAPDSASPPDTPIREAASPGLSNLFEFAPGVWTGSVPRGEPGFESLRALGVRTIVSVDAATPDLDGARAAGLRYVHLPVTYSGIDDGRSLALAKAITELPGPVYIHCHHGLHRAPAAAAVALVRTGALTSSQAVDRMRTAGTSSHYPGLYACVQAAGLAMPGEIASADIDLPERAEVRGFSQSMAELDRVYDELKLIAGAGWRTPPRHPDLSPAAESGELTDLLRALMDLPETREEPADLIARLAQAIDIATVLESAIAAGNVDQASFQLTRLTASCSACHRRYRD